VLVVLVALLFAPLALGRSFWLRDLLEFTYPLKAYLIERMRAGELALWNPRLGLGRPFAGVVQPGVFYPLDVVLVLFGYPRGVDLFFALHALIAALGMRAWLCARGGGDDNGIAATFGGALYGLSGYVVSVLVGNGTYAVGAAWLPWALSAPLSPVRVAIPMALMVLGGDPQAAWFAAALVLVEAATHAERKRALVAAAAGFGLAVALAAVQLGPALEVARVGRPGGVPLTDASHFSFPPLRLFELVWPDLFGPRYGADWLVHPLYDEGSGLAYEPWSAGIYVGLATPLLALAALLGRERRRERALAAVAAVALVVAFGRHTPLWPIWYRFVPGARLFRYPEKYLVVVTLCACALAAIGLRRAVAQPRRALGAGLFGLGALGAGALFAHFVGGAFFAARLGRLEHGSAADLGHTVTSSAVHALFVGVATLAPFVLLLRRRLTPRATTLAVAAIVVVDLFAQSITLTDYVPSALYRETPPPVAAARQLAGGNLLRIYRPLLNVFPSSLPPPVLLRATLRPDCGVDDGIATLDAYDNFPLAHEQALWAALHRQPLRLLAVTGTEFALLPPALFAPREGFVEKARWPALGAVLAQLTSPHRRVYFAGDVRVADDDAAARILAASDFQPGRSLVLAPADGARPIAAADGDCVFTEDRPERLTLRCRSTSASYAVVADAWFPGWYATVDDVPAPLLRANLAMRAVPVPAGDHHVTLVYRPAYLRAGFVVSLFALAFCLFATVRAYRRRA